MEHAYQMAKANGDLENLHEIAPTKVWSYWRLVPNRFPHDKLNRKHLMIVLNRECDSLWDITDFELKQLWRTILPYLDDKYDYFKINGKALRSINNVPHLHVCVYLDEFK